MTGVSAPADRATHEPNPQAVSAVPVGIPDADELIAAVSVSLHPKLEGIVHQYCDEAYAAIMESVQFYLVENAQFNIASILETAKRQKEYYRRALQAIAALEAGPYEFPADWQQQIDSCPECEKYRGHPIQQGICDEHRRPIWNREKHESHEAKAIGHRARRIADEALGGYWHDAQGIEEATADETGTGSVHESPVVEDHAPEPQTHTTKKKGE